MNRLFSRLTLLMAAMFVAVCLTAGCSSDNEKPKGEAGGTYYEGPLKNEKKKTE